MFHLKDILKGIQRKWSGYQNNDILVFFFFFLMSGLFWVLQNLNDEYEMDVEVPIVLQGVPDGVVITTDLPSTLTAKISDKGTSLVSFYSKRLPPVELDFARYDKGFESGRAQVPLNDVRQAIERILSSTTRITTIETDTLEFYYNRGSSRYLPVGLCGRVSAKSHNYIRSLRVQPDSVLVYAPQEVLDTMRRAYTQALNVTELDKTTELKAGFPNIKGVKYEPSEVMVLANVDYYTEKSVEVPVVGLNFPADKSLRTFPSKVKVIFSIGSAYYNQVSSQDFALVITYEDLLNNDRPKYQLNLKSLPQFVSNVRIQPSEVDYLIEQTMKEGGDE